MPVLTKFSTYGEVKDVKNVPFHLIGKDANEAVEIQVSQNSTVEITIADIQEALRECKSKNVL
jgi:hypothetical protein